MLTVLYRLRGDVSISGCCLFVFCDLQINNEYLGSILLLAVSHHARVV